MQLVFKQIAHDLFLLLMISNKQAWHVKYVYNHDKFASSQAILISEVIFSVMLF